MEDILYGMGVLALIYTAKGLRTQNDHPETNQLEQGLFNLPQ